MNQKKITNPTYDAHDNVVWDCVYLGNYLQSEITYLQTTKNNYEVWQILSGQKEDSKEKIKWDANGDTVYKISPYL